MMLTRSDVYGASNANGKTSDQAARAGGAPANPASAGPTTAQQVSSPARAGITPLLGGLILLAIVVVYKLLREWGREADADKDVKIAFHNLVVVTILAGIGIPILKGILNAPLVNNPAVAFIVQPVRDYFNNA